MSHRRRQEDLQAEEPRVRVQDRQARQVRAPPRRRDLQGCAPAPEGPERGEATGEGEGDLELRGDDQGRPEPALQRGSSGRWAVLLHVHRASLRERGGSRPASKDEAVQEGQEEGGHRAEAPRAEGRGGCGGNGRAGQRQARQQGT